VRPVLTLAIEASNPSAIATTLEPGGTSPRVPGVAIGETLGGSSRVLGVESIALDRRHDDDLLPAVDRLMRRLSIGPRDLSRIAVSVGPGGFTGLRVSIASAKAIAEAVGARCVAVPSAHVVARAFHHDRESADRPRPERGFAVALASKGEDTFVTDFDASGTESTAGRIVSAADLARFLAAGPGFGTLLADRFLPAAIAELLTERKIPILAPRFDPAFCFEASVQLPDLDPLDLLPLYPREPEAVRKWRELHRR